MNVMDCYSFNLQGHENIPVTIYELTATIRDKIFDYKQIAESIELDEEQSLYYDILVTMKIQNSVTQTMATSSQRICVFSLRVPILESYSR